MSIIKILRSVFKGINLKILKNAITFWFHNQPNYFKLYIFLKSLNKKPTLTNQKSFIPSVSFIKIGILLSSIKFFKYTLIMAICFIKNPKSADMAKKILSDLWRIVGTNVLLKSMLGI